MQTKTPRRAPPRPIRTRRRSGAARKRRTMRSSAGVAYPKGTAASAQYKPRDAAQPVRRRQSTMTGKYGRRTRNDIRHGGDVDKERRNHRHGTWRDGCATGVVTVTPARQRGTEAVQSRSPRRVRCQKFEPTLQELHGHMAVHETRYGDMVQGRLCAIEDGRYRISPKLLLTTVVARRRSRPHGCRGRRGRTGCRGRRAARAAEAAEAARAAEAAEAARAVEAAEAARAADAARRRGRTGCRGRAGGSAGSRARQREAARAAEAARADGATGTPGRPRCLEALCANGNRLGWNRRRGRPHGPAKLVTTDRVEYDLRFSAGKPLGRQEPRVRDATVRQARPWTLSYLTRTRPTVRSLVPTVQWQGTDRA